MVDIEKPVTIRYRPAETPPPIPAGEMETFIVATVNTAEEVHCFAADYLNDFPLWSEPPLLADRDRDDVHVKAKGCNATGWFDHLPDEDNGAIISPLRLAPDQRLIGWVPVEETAPLTTGK